MKDKKRPKGMIHEFDNILSRAVDKLAMKDVPITREYNKGSKIQATTRCVKEEKARENNLDKATNEYIEKLYLIRMYSLGDCVKGNPGVLKQLLKKLTSKKARYSTLKTNVHIQVKVIV